MCPLSRQQHDQEVDNHRNTRDQHGDSEGDNSRAPTPIETDGDDALHDDPRPRDAAEQHVQRPGQTEKGDRGVGVAELEVEVRAAVVANDEGRPEDAQNYREKKRRRREHESGAECYVSDIGTTSAHAGSLSHSFGSICHVRILIGHMAPGRNPPDIWVDTSPHAARDELPPQSVSTDGPDVIEGGWMLVADDGRIDSLGAGTAPVAEGARVVDVAGAFVAPGFLSSHSHLPRADVAASKLPAATARTAWPA